ncbi:MAG: ABC transporter ATP-binding protein [Anaerolineales bacterium]|nr:ABC transporter ATP-binding protein [Anaerolineales bacterium]
MSEPLVEIKDLKVQFDVRDGIVKAVDGATFTINRGETLGVIGESGCGKSITAKAIMQMVPKPGKVAEGEILYYYRDKNTKRDDPNVQTEIIKINELDPDGDRIRQIRGGEIGMIFQEPMSSLTPVYSAGFQIGEALNLHRLIPIKKVGDQMADVIQQYRHVTKEESREIAIEMLRKVGLPKPQERVDSYPHQLSGGQRQRVMIGIALSCDPAMLIADEPTTALDVSIEAQILDLMRDLQETENMAIMFITHNLGVVAEMAKEIVVMYMGKQVEKASAVNIFYHPKHPYTKALLQSIPKVGKRSSNRLAIIEGMVPSPFELPSGCVFHTRCPDYMPGKCDQIVPKWQEVEDDHYVRCLLYEEV